VLAAAEPLWPEWVAEQRAQAAPLRLLTESLTDQERLWQRVTHGRAIVMVLEQRRQEQAEAVSMAAAARRDLGAALDLAHHVLVDRDAKSTGSTSDRVVSVHDPEARPGTPGDWYTGYLLDVAADADREIITAVNVLLANGAEGADAAKLMTQEEQAHANDVETLSMEGSGFRGDVLRDLTHPQRLRLEVIAPPPREPKATVFGPEALTLDAAGEELTCPNGTKTHKRTRIDSAHGWPFYFSVKQCAGGALRSPCLQKPERRSRRRVLKNDYEAEYRRARAKAPTPAFARVRKEPPKIERQLGDMARWHRARRARDWGQAKIFVPGLLTAMVVHVKRIAH
jgi:hypothetical protein